MQKKNAFYIPFYENKNVPSSALEEDLNSFNIVDCNGAANDDAIVETIAGTEFEIVENIYNRDFEGQDNEHNLPAREENMLSPSGLRVEMMDYNSEFVENQNDRMFIGSEHQMNEALKGSNFICSKCEGSKLEFKLIYSQNKESFVHGISFSCRSCKNNSSVVPSSERMKLPMVGKSKQNWAYKTSIRYAFATLCTGITYGKGAKFLRHMCINPLSHSAYLGHMKQATCIINEKLETMKDETAEKIVEHYIKKGHHLDKGVMDIIVSYDDSWMNRGRNSAYGVAFVVEAETGLILDIHLASSFCLACAKAEKKFKNNHALLKDWKEVHKDNCDRNYDTTKSSGQMEVEAARILFGRSLDRNLRYSTIISDEDSTTFKTICDSNPYEGCHIKKINYLDHIAKKNFRKLEDGKKKEKLGGKGIGKITQNMSNAFSNFYRFAIKKYPGNFEKIRESIFASIDHHMSTDDKPLHSKCSVKWCKYLMDQEKKIDIEPNWHKNLKNRPYLLSKQTGNFMKTIFAEMTTDEVLSKISGKTQNMNESIHSKLRNLLPEAGFRGAKHVQFCIAQVCLDHNYGNRGTSIMDKYGMSPGKPLLDSYVKSKAKRE